MILSSADHGIVFTLEGIEDIDTVKYKADGKHTTHIQLKCSTGNQDASFMDGVLKNYLEAYLIDTDRTFKLVYDFTIAKGFLSKLFSGKLDDAAMEFWKEKINKIKKQTLSWNWSGFDFDDFISKLSFENVKKATLENDIENALIKNWGIAIDNIALYANGIKLLCLDRMESGGDISYDDVAQCIESIKFDISKGIQNPAHAWIQRIVFSKSIGYSSGYYEGKKATPADIANSLPIERTGVEKNVVESIRDNVITVIKTSSGQGKTTLALRSILALQTEYTPYELTWCNSESELVHIVEYFRMRTRIGEKPLILLDNLDSHLSKWNMLAQLMQASVTYHYRILITSRENDWYNYGGDVSNLHSIKVIKPVLEKGEAEAIFLALQRSGKLHSGISDWKESWLKISDRQLLIEYVYLLTHGEMIADRISAQMKEIGNTAACAAKFEILRKVCFADVCGIKLETRALIRSLAVRIDFDPGEMLKSLTDEFLVHISADGDFIEGLHPVRSQHIVNRLHEYMPLDQTALAIAKIAATEDLAVLFSHYPEFDFDKGIFYPDLVTAWWDLNDLSRFVQALRGTFSGSVMQYYRRNKHFFDDVHEHGGLVLVLTDLCPFTKFQGYENELETLGKIAEMMPDNGNIQHLISIRDAIPQFTIVNTDAYYLSNALFQKLRTTDFGKIDDVESYAIIVDWLYNMDSALNLAPGIDLSNLWLHAESYTLKAVSSLMYSVFCGNKDAYDAFLKDNLQAILGHLKRKTKSHMIKVDDGCIKVEYILRASEKKCGNEESVSRLKDICRTLPVFEKYCSDAISPHINLLDGYIIPDDAHKEMPRRNLIITFHQEFNSLWLKTIESNYEFDTVYAWVENWLQVRQCACDLLKACCQCMHRILEGKKADSAASSFALFHMRYNKLLRAPLSYPREHRPFEEKLTLPEQFRKAKGSYFDGIQNYSNQFIQFIKREKNSDNLALYNLRTVLAALPNMQRFFEHLELEEKLRIMHNELCMIEEHTLMDAYMCCEYYLSHTPNPRFKKYDIKAYFELSKKTEIADVNSLLGALNTVGAVFPKKVYRENIFTCYPILLRDFDVTDETMMQAFLLQSIAFADASYDYLVMLIADGEGKIIPNALKFPKRAFQCIQAELYGKDFEYIEDFTSPFPVEVTSDMLECFGGEFMLQEQSPDKEWLGRIGDIGEELWVYSKTRELLSDESDRKYLNDSLTAVRMRIDDILGLLGSLPDSEIESLIRELCSEVYSGEVFDDKKYNELIDCIQAMSTSKDQ